MLSQKQIHRSYFYAFQQLCTCKQGMLAKLEINITRTKSNNHLQMKTYESVNLLNLETDQIIMLFKVAFNLKIPQV